MELVFLLLLALVGLAVVVPISVIGGLYAHKRITRLRPNYDRIEKLERGLGYFPDQIGAVDVGEIPAGEASTEFENLPVEVQHVAQDFCPECGQAGVCSGGYCVICQWNYKPATGLEVEVRQKQLEVQRKKTALQAKRWELYEEMEKKGFSDQAKQILAHST